MPLLAVVRAILKHTGPLRYGDSLNSSQRYLIRAREGLLKRTKRPFHQHFGASKQTSDHNLKVNIGGNRIYGRVANLHVNKTRNMASASGGSGFHDSQKENDDISLPFWIFLWSFLAVVAGFIYSKLNRQQEIESEQKSGVQPDVNDEQIARKLVKEIARKDSGKKTIFRRQRSYEIIDGEVRIHYDVSMLEDSLNKSASFEGFLKTAEVESIPIRSASLEDLEFVYPGKLPSIVEEGDEDLEDQSDEQTPLTGINAGRPDAQTDFDETKGKETKKNTTKIQNISNSNENTCNVEVNRLHFEKKQNEFPTSFETITQETLIPAESINDEGKITINPQKDNCVAFKHETEAELKEIKNETSLNENSDEDDSSSISGDSVIENVSEMSDVSNSLHYSNTSSNDRTTSVYKLSKVERSQQNQFTVTRQEITKLKSSEKVCPNSNSFNNETSFSIAKSKGEHRTGGNCDDCSQLSKDLQSDKFDPEKFPRDGEVVKEVSSGDVYECPETTLDGNKVIVKLSEDDLNECPTTSFPDERCAEEPRALTFLEESNILVDNSGDILFKVIGPSTEDAYLEVENEEHISEESSSDEVATDENQNVDRFGGKNELAKNWNSLPSWEGAHSIKHRELNSDSSDIGYIDLDTNIVDDTEEDSSGVDQALFLQGKNDDLEQKNLGVVREEFEMQKGEVFNEDIKEAHLLTFENKIGSRRTIFVKDITKPVHSGNGERVKNSIEKTGLDDIKADEEVPTFEELESENISDEIIVAVQTHEDECPDHADPASEEPVFATASVAEEHVVKANIITDSEPSTVKIDMLEPSGKTQTTAVRTTQTEMQLTQVDVHSIVKKFEEARKQETSIQTQNDCTNSGSDKTTVLKNRHEQTDEDIETEESSTFQETELVDHDQLSEYQLDENEEGKPPDNNTDDSQTTELVLIPDFVVETKPDPSNEPHIKTDSINLVENIPTNVSSIDNLESQPCTVEIKSDEEVVIYANQVTEVTASDENSSETIEAINARHVDDYSPIVVYASQVTDSESISDTHREDESKQPNANSSCGLDKRNNSSTTVVYADVLSSNTTGTTVIYANQDSDVKVIPQPILEPTNQSQTKNITPNYITEEEKISNQETPDMDLRKPTPTPPQPNDEKRNFRETSFDATPLTSSPVMNASSSNVKKSNLSNVKTPSSTIPDQLPNDSLHDIKEEKFSSRKISSNVVSDFVTNQTPSEVDKNILSSDIIPSFSSPLHKVNESPSSLWQNLPRGETDVDNLSDIDEIDIDILPDENYQKSKSVTDLDEALASFGSLDYLSNDAVDPDTVTGSLSKSVPDILDSCREESLRETVGNTAEKLQKKNLSLSTPEINSKPGSKKVTKIKVVHVKFLEMESDSENVEEDSFIYDGDLPITGKMKRRSRNLSEEFSSPVASPPFYSPAASPPPDLSKEIAEERWVADKTNFKQLEFEFGDLFQNSPSPPVLEANIIKDKSSIDGLNQSTRRETHEDTVKFQDVSMAYSLPDNLSYETTDKPLNASNNLTLEYPDPSPPDSSEKPSLTDINKQSFQSLNGGTASSSGTSRFEKQIQRPKESPASTVKTSTTTQSSTRITSESKSKSYFGRSSEGVIPALHSETKITLSTKKLHQNSNIIHSRKMLSSNAKTKVEYKNTQDNSSRISETTSETAKNQDISSNLPERNPQSSTRTESVTYRYTPGNSRSYSKAPKPSPEHGKYVVRTGMIAAQSSSKETGYIAPQTRHTDNSPKNTAHFTERPTSARHITTQARYIDSPLSAASSSSPKHGIKLSEKFRMSDEGNLAKKTPGDDRMSATNTRDGLGTRKSNQKRSDDKETSRHGGRLVTVKSGIISDYECSSDADSEMSYNVPSPRIKAKRFHRPQVNRVDSVSSSEPDSPRREVRSERRSMSELFGVDAPYQNSSDTSKEMGSQNSLRNQTIFAKFGNVGEREGPLRQDESFGQSNPGSTVFDPRSLQPSTRERGTGNSHSHYSNDPQRNPGSPNVYQPRVTTFDEQRFTDSKPYNNRRQTNTLERNLSPTSFLHEGNLDSGDHMSPKTIEFNSFEDIEARDSFQPFQRCHSPSSVYSDTSSVFSFNCDFDPMPPPTGKYEPEVYTCENPMCKKQDILLGPEKTNFKSCPACFTYYCSSECRKLHWPSHKQSCYFGRVNTYVRSIIRLCQRREDLSMYLSQLARDGYNKKGRGVVMAIFNSPELAREFITKGHDAFSGRKPTYSSLTELHREGIISKHRVALMQAVRDYEPNQEFVFNIAVVATNNIPIVPAPRYKLNTVLHCIKMPLNDLIVAREPKDYEKVETRLFALPKCSRHEFVNEMEARRHYCRNLSKNLRQYNVKLKEDYPECYRKLCMYVEHNISFEPMTVYGQRGGLNYKCVIAPEQSYPLNAEYC